MQIIMIKKMQGIQHGATVLGRLIPGGEGWYTVRLPICLLFPATNGEHLPGAMPIIGEVGE